MNDYQKLFSLSKKARLLEGISFLLEWDQETYMPKHASSLRAEQLELMASLTHKERTSPSFKKALEKLIDLKTGHVLDTGLDERQKAALKAWRRDYLKAASLPNAFVKAFAKLSCESMTVWSEARGQNSFSMFAPYLEKILSMCRKKADYLGYKDHPYDALLDLFEPGMTTAEITPLFSSVKKGIMDLLLKIAAAPSIDDHFLGGSFSEEKQMEIGKKLLIAMGIEQEKGRLDLSTHPFSMTIHPSDSRLTTRINPARFFESLSAVLHEGGHSLYEMGMNPEYYGSPLCEAVSLGIHESQSRLWETRIGQSKPFWKHFLPLLKTTFAGQLDTINLNQFYKAINKVQPSMIRVESDEVTYSLHVILRFELEKHLIEGSLQVSELPEAWNHLMYTYLGISPESDREGCLQDIHWSMGAFGYFPTYTLGNLYAALFFEAFEKEYPEWEARIAQGDLQFLREWLQEKIHKHGRAYSAEELAKNISNRKLNEKPYLGYLNKKYKDIYSL